MMRSSPLLSVWNIVKVPIWTGFRAASRVHLALHGDEFRYVFILGHMRSGSSLLSHILSSNPDFAGAGETHICYRAPADLPKLALKTCEMLHRPFLRARYVVDQINHDYVTDAVLLSDRVYRSIILLREPMATLKSMMKLSIWDEAQARDVYVQRLERLARYGSLLGERAMLVEYDDLVEHAEETLAVLTRFLDLRTPLSPTYTTHRMTGRISGYGDPSDNIKAGRVIRTPPHQITIGNGTLEAAAAAFRRSREQLQSTTARSGRSGSSGG